MNYFRSILKKTMGEFEFSEMMWMKRENFWSKVKIRLVSLALCMNQYLPEITTILLLLTISCIFPGDCANLL